MPALRRSRPGVRPTGSGPGAPVAGPATASTPGPGACSLVPCSAWPGADLDTAVGNHACCGTGITTYLRHPDVKLEEVQVMATHADPEAIRLRDRRNRPVAIDDLERIRLQNAASLLSQYQ